MAFDWSTFLDLAAELAQRDDEASQRSAISRAYYAALGKCREFLEGEGEQFTSSANLHSAIWQAFSSSEDDRRYYIGNDGRWLRFNRNSADYDPIVTEPAVRARQAIRKAQTILAALERLRATA